MSAGKRMVFAWHRGKTENKKKKKPNPRGRHRKLVRNQIREIIRKKRIAANRGKGATK